MGLIKIGSHLKARRFSDAFWKPQLPIALSWYRFPVTAGKLSIKTFQESKFLLIITIGDRLRGDHLPNPVARRYAG